MVVIFVVVGHAGQHDDYRSWMSKGFHKRDDAVVHQRKCIDEANRVTREIKTMEEERFTYPHGGMVPEIEEPLRYWSDVQAIIDSNKTDDYFEYDEDIDYTVDALEVE